MPEQIEEGMPETEIQQGQEAQPEQVQNEPDDSPKPSRAKPRFNTTASEEAARMRAMASDYESSMGDEPNLEAMDHDVEKFTGASIDRKHKGLAAEILRKTAEAKEQEAAKSIQSSWGEVVDEARKAYPDFDKVFDSNTRVSKPMAEAIMSADAPGDIAYYLGRNKGEAARIAALPPHLQGYEIAQVEKAMVNRKRATQTPEPATKQVSGVRAGPKSAANMSFSEYSAQRDKSRASR